MYWFKKNIFALGIQYNKVLAVLNDAAAYMIAARGSLRILFPKMLHLTCFSHGLHRVAGFIRLQFPNVNQLISKSKSVFVKVICFYFTLKKSRIKSNKPISGTVSSKEVQRSMAKFADASRTGDNPLGVTAIISKQLSRSLTHSIAMTPKRYDYRNNCSLIRA